MPTNSFKQKGMEGITEGTQESVADDILADGTTTPTSETRKERAQAQDNSSIEEERRQKARQRIYEAYAWIQTYPRAFQFVSDYLQSEYEQGHRLSMQAAWELLRQKEWTGTKGETFRLNNNLRSALSRILLLENPRYRNKLELRRSPLDEVMGIGR